MAAVILPFAPRTKFAQPAPVAVMVSLPAKDHDILARYCERGGISVSDALADLAKNLVAHCCAPERQ